MSEPEKKPDGTSVISPGNASSDTLPGSPCQPAVIPPVVVAQEAKPEDLPVGTPGRRIPLKFPFKSGDKTLNAVSFTRRPRARDLIQHVGAATAAEQELHGIAALIGVIPEDLMEMDGADYLAVQKEWAGFLTV